ncbi:MAG: hypothetical protein EPO10_13820 [Reyranella sp.]|nr:MAG: hypothetical protein EPO10_13820 [Reyranella sp.]|tara:strand:- start:369 stop:746 length:378 start_codon:yes stop_codon:yes gene_type:complete
MSIRVLGALSAAIVLWASMALAQHHMATKGPSGGPLRDIVGVHAELMVAGNTVTINLLDEHSKPSSAKGFSGAVLFVGGSASETVPLTVFGDSALKGEARAPIPPDAQVTLILKNPAGKSGQAKF